MTAEEVAKSGDRGKLRQVQLVCEDGCDSASMTIVNVIKLARESFKIERKNATIFSRETDLEAESVKIRATVRTMRS